MNDPNDIPSLTQLMPIDTLAAEQSIIFDDEFTTTNDDEKKTKSKTR